MMNSENEAVMIKWRYRDVKEKGSVKGYERYIEKQAEERRNGTGEFSLQENLLIGMDEHDQNKIIELSSLPTVKEYEERKYENYINSRKGSYGCFSDEDVSIKDSLASLNNHTGYVWIPIVSLKEMTAEKFDLESEASWISSAREIAESYREIMGIAKDNYRWLAAFHVKPDELQNKNADSGCQPHLHFIIWEEKPLLRRPTLKKEQLEKVHMRTASLLSRKYMKNFYEERNNLEKNIKEKSEESLLSLADEIEGLGLDLKSTTRGKGKISFGVLLKRKNSLSVLYGKLLSGNTLNETDTYCMNFYRINNADDCKRVLDNYAALISELDVITQKVLESEEIKPIIEAWSEISLKMRKYQGESFAGLTTWNDLEEIRKEVRNIILRSARSVYGQNTMISDELKSDFMERIENGWFKKQTGTDEIIGITHVIAVLCKSMKIAESSCQQIEKSLLERSGKSYLKNQAEDKIRETYKNAALFSEFTSKDFYKAMRAISVPVTEKMSKYRTVSTNRYQFVSSNILKPVSQTLLSLSQKTILDKKFSDIFSDSSVLISDTPENRGGYDAMLNNYFSALNNLKEKINVIASEESELTI